MRINPVIHCFRRAVLLQSSAGETDGQLLESFILHKDDLAFEALFRRHGPMVLNVCRRVIRNHHDAEDAFQATFLALARAASSVRQRETVAGWLYRVAYRISLRARLLTTRRQKRERMVMEMPEPEVTPQNSWHDLKPLLDRELDSLPDNYRLPIVFCDLEGKSVVEAARQLGWPQGTFACRLARGRKALAKRLTRHGLTFSTGWLATHLFGNASTAAVPAALADSTIKAAIDVAAGNAAKGLVSSSVAALMQGGLHAMFLIKLKKIIAVMFAVAVLGTGIGSAVLWALDDSAQTREVRLDENTDAGGSCVQERQAEDGEKFMQGKVISVARDGQSFVLESPSRRRNIKEKPVRTKITINKDTDVTFYGIAPAGTKTIEGLQVLVHVKMGKTLSVTFTASGELRRDIGGTIASISEDGKSFTIIVLQTIQCVVQEAHPKTVTHTVIERVIEVEPGTSKEIVKAVPKMVQETVMTTVTKQVEKQVLAPRVIKLTAGTRISYFGVGLGEARLSGGPIRPGATGGWLKRYRRSSENHSKRCRLAARSKRWTRPEIIHCSRALAGLFARPPLDWWRGQVRHHI